MHKYMIDAIKGLLKVNQKDDCVFPFFGYVFYHVNKVKKHGSNVFGFNIGLLLPTNDRIQVYLAPNKWQMGLPFMFLIVFHIPSQPIIK